MCASINGFKPEDAKSAHVFRLWYTKSIFQTRSFLIANYNELFKGSTIFQEEDIPQSENSITRWFDNLKSSDNAIMQILNRITGE